MKKVIITLGIMLFVGICFVVFNPFFWGMQAKPPKTPQPEMTKVESEFIKKLEIECNCEVKRFFHNYKKESIDSTESKKYNNDSFYYSIDFSGKSNKFLDKINKNNYNIVKYLKDLIIFDLFSWGSNPKDKNPLILNSKTKKLERNPEQGYLINKISISHFNTNFYGYIACK